MVSDQQSRQLTASETSVLVAPSPSALLFAAWMGALLCGYAAVLWGDWSSNDQYAYGFFVPLLTALLLGLRWNDMPPPSALGEIPLFLARSILVFLSVLACPFILVYMANPDWRFLLWFWGAWTVCIAVALILLAGGLAWARHFVLAWSLVLTAIPWPTMLEGPLLRTLLQSVTFSTVTILQLAGVAVAQVGNTIQLSGGSIGVEEACSGIRSFQLALMAGVFCGEYYRLNLPRRIGLLAATLGIAFVVNLVRSGTLALIFQGGGPELMQVWHDRIGLVAMLIVPLIGLLIARTLQERSERPGEPGPASEAPPSCAEEATVGSARGISHARFPGWIAFAAACSLVVVCAIGAETYFRVAGNPTGTADPHGFEILSPSPGFKRMEIPSTIRAALRYTRANTWIDSDESHKSYLMGFNAIWEKGEMSTFVGVHRPETCIPSAGLKLVADHGMITYSRPDSGDRLRFRSHEYSNGQDTLQVFYASGAISSGGDALARDGSGRQRIQEAFAGHRLESRWLIQIVVGGNATKDVAWLEARKFLDGSVIVRSPG